MKFATVQRESGPVVVAVDADQGLAWFVHEVAGQKVTSMLDLIQRCDGLGHQLTLSEPVDLASLEIEAPIPRPERDIFCIGKNYREHAQEFTGSGFDSSANGKGDAIPDEPIVFGKLPHSVISHLAPVRYPAGVSDSLDYEAELAVIIGRDGRCIPRDRAFDHVWGYTILNDITARDLQKRHKQWLLGKSLDTFCPMGPWVVTRDEIDGGNLSIRCWVNEELRQDGNTRDLIFDIPTLIETISAAVTLRAGDIIATGTPAGVGIGFEPPRFLARGDRVTIEISGIGTLSNVIQ